MNVREAIRLDGNVHDVLRQLSQSDDRQLEAITVDMDASEIRQNASWITKQCQQSSRLKTFIYGGLLNYHTIVTRSPHHKTAMNDLLDELEISQTQAYRCIAVWVCFRYLLRSELDVLSRFSAESLKILASKSSTEQIREQALARARRGEQITQTIAEQLIESMSSSDVDDIELVRDALPSRCQAIPQGRFTESGKDKTSKWEFRGRVSRVVVRVNKRSMEDIEAIIHDLKDIVSQFEQQAYQEVAL
jgi:hypothetical protein